MLFSVEDLIRHGHLGPARAGMSRDEIRAALGPPDSWLAERTVERSPIWRYGTFEVHFNDPGSDRASALYTDYLDPETMSAGPGRLLGRWILAERWPRTFEATRARLLWASVPACCFLDALGRPLLRVEPAIVDLSFDARTLEGEPADPEGGHEGHAFEWSAICAHAPGCALRLHRW